MREGDVWRTHQAVLDELPPPRIPTYPRRCGGRLVADDAPERALRIVTCDECHEEYAIPRNAQPPAHDSLSMAV